MIRIKDKGGELQKLEQSRLIFVRKLNRFVKLKQRIVNNIQLFEVHLLRSFNAGSSQVCTLMRLGLRNISIQFEGGPRLAKKD